MGWYDRDPIVLHRLSGPASIEYYEGYDNKKKCEKWYIWRTMSRKNNVLK